MKKSVWMFLLLVGLIIAGTMFSIALLAPAAEQSDPLQVLKMLALSGQQDASGDFVWGRKVDVEGTELAYVVIYDTKQDVLTLAQVSGPGSALCMVYSFGDKEGVFMFVQGGQVLRKIPLTEEDAIRLAGDFLRIMQEHGAYTPTQV